MKRLLLSLLLLSSAGPALAQQAQASAAPGDVLRLVVWRAPEFSGDFLIASDGTLQHPLMTEVRVAGVPAAQVRQRITEVLRRFESDPHFVYTILHRISVTGEVRVPGLYPLTGETTLSQAVAAAGGPTNFASGKVRLSRGGQITVLDLRGAGAGAATMTVQPGDELDVPRQSNWVRDIMVPMATVVGAIAAIVGIVQ
jgi:polysaccharide biosynthesis/export protein